MSRQRISSTQTTTTDVVLQRELWGWRLSSHSFVLLEAGGLEEYAASEHTGCSSNFCNGLRRLESAFLAFQDCYGSVEKRPRLATDENKDAEVCRKYRIPGFSRWRQKATIETKQRLKREGASKA